MFRLPRHSLKRRVTRVLMACSSLVAVVVSLVFLIFQALEVRREFESDLQVVGRVVADNCAASLAFGDPKAALEVLGTLRSRPEIVAAFVQTGALGEVFVRYGQDGPLPSGVPGRRDSVRFTLQRLEVDLPIGVGGQWLGSLCLVAETGPMYRRMLMAHLTLLSVLVPTAVLFAYLLAARLERRISAPIRALAETARTVTRTNDYSVRAEVTDDEELGVLARGFNQMLEQMDRRSDELERAVVERTEAMSRALDAAQAASQAKSQFLANMSHEIRTPLNGVMGMLHVLRRSPLNTRQQREVGVALSSAETLLTVLGDVLDFSRIEAGRLALEAVVFDPVEVMESALRLFAEKAESKRVELVCLPVADGVPGAVRGDPHRLRQVLINLIGNALKFTDRGEIVLGCTRTREDMGGGGMELRFEVRDTGCGIAEEDRSRIFDAFAQVDGSMARTHGGAGLGLAICRQLTALMGGGIGVDSRVGEGSRFWFTVRLQAVSESAGEPVVLSGLDGLRVLVVEDNDMARLAICRHIEGWEACPEGVSRADAVVPMLRAAAAGGDPFDVVLLDTGLRVEGGGGAEMLRRIRSEAAGSGSRLVLMRGHATVFGSGNALSDSGDLALVKPVGRVELHETLRLMAGQMAACTAGGRPEDPIPTGRGELVLVAEDNEIGQEVAREILVALGYRCLTVASGVEAVAAARRDDVDYILMDCQLPGLDGYEATRRIRDMELQLARQARRRRSVPIIALTAHAMAGDRARCLDSGMDDYLTKPLDPERLARLLRAWTLPPGPAVPSLSPGPVLASVDAQVSPVAGAEQEERNPGGVGVGNGRAMSGASAGQISVAG